MNFINTGWKCPGCGRCYSPSTTMCSYCHPIEIKTIPSPSTNPPNLTMTCCYCGAVYLYGTLHSCTGPLDTTIHWR